jgi:hypothetical protein
MTDRLVTAFFLACAFVGLLFWIGVAVTRLS